MANIDIENIWETEVLEISTTDQVLGGETGVANVQSKHLANREEYLKNKIDALTNLKQITATESGSIRQETSNQTQYIWPGFTDGGILSITSKSDYSRFRISFNGYADTSNTIAPIFLNLHRSIDGGISWKDVLVGGDFPGRQRALSQVPHGTGTRNAANGTFNVIDNPNVERNTVVKYKVMVRCLLTWNMVFQHDGHFYANTTYSSFPATLIAQEIPI